MSKRHAVRCRGGLGACQRALRARWRGRVGLHWRCAARLELGLGYVRGPNRMADSPACSWGLCMLRDQQAEGRPKPCRLLASGAPRKPCEFAAFCFFCKRPRPPPPRCAAALHRLFGSRRARMWCCTLPCRKCRLCSLLRTPAYPPALLIAVCACRPAHLDLPAPPCSAAPYVSHLATTVMRPSQLVQGAPLASQQTSGCSDGTALWCPSSMIGRATAHPQHACPLPQPLPVVAGLLCLVICIIGSDAAAENVTLCWGEAGAEGLDEHAVTSSHP